MGAARVHGHEPEQHQTRHHDHHEEPLDRQPVPGEKPADGRPYIRKDADDPDAPEVEVRSSDEAAADIDGGRRHEGDRGDPEHPLVEVDGNPLVLGHAAPNTTCIPAASSYPWQPPPCLIGPELAGTLAGGAGRRPGEQKAGMEAGGSGKGQAAEPPLRVESREELVYLLGEACELEHGLLCEYLYAQFSLKRRVDEGGTPAQLARIRAW